MLINLNPWLEYDDNESSEAVVDVSDVTEEQTRNYIDDRLVIIQSERNCSKLFIFDYITVPFT